MQTAHAIVTRTGGDAARATPLSPATRDEIERGRSAGAMRPDCPSRKAAVQAEKTMSAFDFAVALVRRTGLAIGQCAFALAMRAGGRGQLLDGDLVESSDDVSLSLTR